MTKDKSPMLTPDMFIHSGREARDLGIEQVLKDETDWRAVAEFILRSEFRGLEITAEFFRLECEDRGVIPHHPNAWGGFWYGQVTSGHLADTGRTTRAKCKPGHARRLPIWRVL